MDWTRIGLFSPLCAVNSSFGGARRRRHDTLAGKRRRRRQRFHVCIRRAFEFASEATAEKNRRAPGGAHWTFLQSYISQVCMYYVLIINTEWQTLTSNKWVGLRKRAVLTEFIIYHMNNNG